MREFRPELVLLDIGMPMMDGYEVCRRLRQDPYTQDAVVIALTGWGLEEDRQRARSTRDSISISSSQSSCKHS